MARVNLGLFYITINLLIITLAMECALKKNIVLTPDDPVLNTLNFKPFRSMMQRRVEPFLPKPSEPQTKQVITPWGAALTAKKGDMLVSEMDRPDDVWPINPRIFDESYVIVGPGLCVKRAITLLVPLTDITGGDEEQLVEIHTLEGAEVVRAGDFLLAKGVKGEIWPYPKEKAEKNMRPVV